MRQKYMMEIKVRITGTLKNADVIDNVQVTVSAQLKNQV